MVSEAQSSPQPSAFTISVVFGGAIGLVGASLLGIDGGVGFFIGTGVVFLVLSILVIHARQSEIINDKLDALTDLAITKHVKEEILSEQSILGDVFEQSPYQDVSEQSLHRITSETLLPRGDLLPSRIIDYISSRMEKGISSEEIQFLNRYFETKSVLSPTAVIKGEPGDFSIFKRKWFKVEPVTPTRDEKARLDRILRLMMAHRYVTRP